ncbi:MAG: F0F1 ATP synthase subunit delta, partial [Pseudomonadota bacterium]
MASVSSDVGEIARRYALALYDVAEAGGAVDAVAGDLGDLRRMIASSADLQAFIFSPSLSRKELAETVSALAKGAKFHQITA